MDAKLFRIYPGDIQRLEYTGLRLADGKIEAFGKTLDDWPERLEFEYGKGSFMYFELEESDDDNHYTPDNAPEGSIGSMAWYVPATDKSTT